MTGKTTVKVITLATLVQKTNTICIAIIHTFFVEFLTKFQRIRTNYWIVIDEKNLFFFFTCVFNFVHCKKNYVIFTLSFKTTRLISWRRFYYKTPRIIPRFFFLKIFLKVYFVSTIKFLIKLVVHTTIWKRILITNCFKFEVLWTR